MSVKLNDLGRDRVPASNAYDADVSKLKVMKQAPVYSHRWRTGDPLSLKGKRPGPAEYNLMNHNPFEKSASYTMGSRLNEFKFVPIVPMDNC